MGTTDGSSTQRLVLDHLVYGVPDLAAGVEFFAERTGVRPSAGGSHPGFGTANALLALGPATYLEILGPDPEQPDPERPRPFGLDLLESPRLLGWAVKAPEIDRSVRRARQRGYDPGPVRAMSRRRPDGVKLAWRLAVPETWSATLNGLIPFLIDWGTAPHPAATAAAGCRLETLRGRHPRPWEVARRLAAVEVGLELVAGVPAGLEAVLHTPAGDFGL